MDVSLSEGTKLYARYNLQRERQPFSVALWGRWRGIGDPARQTPYPSPVHGDNRSDSVTVALTHVFDPSLTSETVLAFTYIDFSNVLDNPAAGSRQGVGYPYGGVFGQSQRDPGRRRRLLRPATARSTPTTPASTRSSSRRNGSGASSRT